MRTLDKITTHRRKELMMTSQRSGMGFREELERLLANNSLSLLGSEARTNGQEQTPRQQQHQTIQEERLALFRTSSVRPRPGPTTTTSSTAATPGPSASASYFSSRSYGPAAGGRGRSMPVSWARGQAVRRPAPFAPGHQHQPPKKKFVAKDIYLMEAIDVPRGPKRVMIFDNKQVQTAVQLDADNNPVFFLWEN